MRVRPQLVMAARRGTRSSSIDDAAAQAFQPDELLPRDLLAALPHHHADSAFAAALSELRLRRGSADEAADKQPPEDSRRRRRCGSDGREDTFPDAVLPITREGDAFGKIEIFYTIVTNA